MNEEVKQTSEKVIPLNTEAMYEDALSDLQKEMREQNPETIKILNDIHQECKSIIWTILQNFPPEGHVKNTVDMLFSAVGFTNLSLEHYGSAESRILFEDTSTKELDEEINDAIPKDLIGTQVRKLKEIRMLILGVGKRMDAIGNTMTNFDAARMLGQARNDVHRAVIFCEEALKNIGYILTQNKPSIISAGGLK